MTAAGVELKPVLFRDDELEEIDKDLRKGILQRYLGFYDDEVGVRVRIGSAKVLGEFYSPRHKHTFEQLRYVLSGEMKYGSEPYGPGDLIYIPESCHYGPMQPVNQTTGSTSVLWVDMQWMGPSGIPYSTPDEIVQARAELGKSGTFEKGVYRRKDGSNQDGYEAIIEHLTGGPVEYPDPRFSQYFAMHAEAFPWVPSQRHAGVEVRHLASFQECGPSIRFVRMTPGASLSAGNAVGHQARFITSGQVTYDGETYPALSYMFVPAKAGYLDLAATGDTPTEFLLVEWGYDPNTSPLVV